MVFLISGRNMENIERRRKQAEEKIEKWRERKTRKYGRSNNSNKHLWCYLLYKKSCLARKHNFKKWFIPSHFIYSFYALQDIFWDAVMIHQSSYRFALVFRPHDLQPEKHIKRLSSTTQIFIAMDYFIRSSRPEMFLRSLVTIRM